MMLAALVAAAALSAAPASAATPPRDFVGVTAREPMSSTELGRLAGSKARVYRVLPEATQARYLSDLYRQAMAARGTLKLAGPDLVQLSRHLARSRRELLLGLPHRSPPRERHAQASVDGVQPLRALCALSPRAGMTVRARGGG
jgi:hypothetical protein